MNFGVNDYLSWYIPRMRQNPGAVNLHASGVAALSPADFTLQLDCDWELTARFETALARWLELPAEEIIFTPGATGGNLLAILTLAKRGSKIVVEHPIYEPMLRQARCVARVERIARSFESGWRLALDQAARVIDRDTSVVMITEPHNPSGVFSPVEQVMELAAIAQASGAFLLINEVYRGFADRPSYHRAADNIVVVNSLSKLMGAYWMRLGWLSAAKEIVDGFRVGHSNMGVPTVPAAALGLAVMENADERVNAARTAASQGFPIVKAWVESNRDIAWREPDGIGFCCLKIQKDADDIAFAQTLLEKSGVLIVPGSMFSMPGTLRVSWLQAGHRLEEGLVRLAEGLSQLKR